MAKDIGDMIREQRERLGISQAELARRIGIAQPSLHNIENGRTKRSRYLPDIYDALGMDPRTQRPIDVGVVARAPSAAAIHREPMTGPGAMRDFPVYNMLPPADGDDNHMLLTADPVDMVERPSLLGAAKDSFGVGVYGDEMSPAYKPGDILFVRPYEAPVVGRDVVIRPGSVSDLRVVIGELIGVTAEDWIVKQHKQPDKKLRFNRKEWSRLDGIIGKYNRR